MPSMPPSKPPIIREYISRRTLRSLFKNFRSFAEAVQELVDNAFDKFNGFHGGRELKIRIEVSKDKVVVENIGGRGMGLKELESWLIWGRSDTSAGIGEYGQGGKAAMGYIGNAWRVQCKKFDEETIWQIEEQNWADESDAPHEYVPTPLPLRKDLEGLGYCKIEISKLNPLRHNLEYLSAQLGNIYRVLLENQKAAITMNGKFVEPYQIPLYEASTTQSFNRNTSTGVNLKGWIGRLKRDARSRSPIRIPGGLRLLRQGRLVCDGEYFSHPGPSSKASLNRLIGEVELPRSVPVLPNKTNFDRSSTQWNAVLETMFEVLKPHIQELLTQSDEVIVTKEEKKRASSVRELLKQALIKRIAEEGEPPGIFGSGVGRKPPEPRTGSTTTRPPINPTPKSHTPRTAPSDGAVGILKRLGTMPRLEIRSLDPGIRSTFLEEGQNGSAEKILVINKTFPLYQERSGDELYMAETAVLELTKPTDPGSMTPAQYLDEATRLLEIVCKLWRNPSLDEQN